MHTLRWKSRDLSLGYFIGFSSLNKITEKWQIIFIFEKFESCAMLSWKKILCLQLLLFKWNCGANDVLFIICWGRGDRKIQLKSKQNPILPYLLSVHVLIDKPDIGTAITPPDKQSKNWPNFSNGKIVLSQVDKGKQIFSLSFIYRKRQIGTNYWREIIIYDKLIGTRGATIVSWLFCLFAV